LFILALRVCEAAITKKQESFYRIVFKFHVMAKNALGLAAMEKLLKQAGNDRVSEDAKAALRDVLEEYALDLGKKAGQFAKHANRKTVKETDVFLARKH